MYVSKVFKPRYSCWCFCFQYQRLQLMYNISNEGDNFVVYRNAKHAESLDKSTWCNARCAQQACMNCKKRRVHTPPKGYRPLWGRGSQGLHMVLGLRCGVLNQSEGQRCEGGKKSSE